MLEQKTINKAIKRASKILCDAGIPFAFIFPSGHSDTITSWALKTNMGGELGKKIVKMVSEAYLGSQQEIDEKEKQRSGIPDAATTND